MMTRPAADSSSAKGLRRIASIGLSLVAALSVALGGCGMMPAKDKHPDNAPPRVLPPPTPRTDGAIYQAGQEMALFADLKARRVGDVLTIVLNESTNASKNAATTDRKSTRLNSSH